MIFTPAQEFQHEDSYTNLFIRNWTVELERFRKKTPSQLCCEVHLGRVIDIQMGYLEGIHQANDLNLCCPQEFYFANERLLFVGVFPGKSRCRKGKQLYGRISYRPKKFTLQSAIGPRGYYKTWFSENKANNAEVKHFVVNKYAHAPSLGGPPLPTVIPLSWIVLADRVNNPSKQHYNPVSCD